MILGVEAVRVLELGVHETHLLGLRVHHLNEFLLATRNALGDGHGGIVTRVNEETGDEVAQRDLLSGNQSRARLSHGCRTRRNGEDFVKVTVFERDDCRHRLGDGGHRTMLVLPARPQDVTVLIDEYAVGRLFHGSRRPA